MAGRTPMSAPGAATIPSCRFRCRSRPRPAAACARAGPYADAVRAHLADALTDICRRAGASSVHVTFPTEPEWDLLGARGYLKRTHQQFHWENAGYATFDAFLAALASRKRKTIRRERADALTAGISVHWLTGTDLTESVWDAFFDFYM